MTKREKRWLACAACALFIGLFIHWSTPVLMDKKSRDRFDDFYESGEKADVLYLGTSHVMNGFIPLELWQEHGFAAHNIAAAGLRIPTMYWQLRSALAWCNPKLVILDCAYLMDDKHNTRVIEYSHAVFDSMPMNWIRFQAVLDLFEDPEERLRFLLPFSVYHSRWSELSKQDFQEPTSRHRGYAFSLDHEAASFSGEDADSEDESIQIDNNATRYLDRIEILCRERGIPLMLTMIPFATVAPYDAEEHWIASYAKQKGLPFLSSDEILQSLWPAQDFANFSEDNSHLNYGGALRFTKVLGEYLTRFELPDRRGDPAYAEWDAAAKEERANFFSRVQKENTLQACFQLAARSGIEIDLIVGSEACLKQTVLSDVFFGSNIRCRAAALEDAMGAFDVAIILTDSEAEGRTFTYRTSLR